MPCRCRKKDVVPFHRGCCGEQLRAADTTRSTGEIDLLQDGFAHSRDGTGRCGGKRDQAGGGRLRCRGRSRNWRGGWCRRRWRGFRSRCGSRSRRRGRGRSRRGCDRSRCWCRRRCGDRRSWYRGWRRGGDRYGCRCRGWGGGTDRSMSAAGRCRVGADAAVVTATAATAGLDGKYKCCEGRAGPSGVQGETLFHVGDSSYSRACHVSGCPAEL